MNGKRNYLSFPVEMRTTGNWRSPEPFRSAAGRAGLTGVYINLSDADSGEQILLANEADATENGYCLGEVAVR